uniref:Uncharacterized protein n=1 Tax=Arundo donax TaxID=35708 RepID=A0A0A8YTF0_ARUDO
MSCKPLTMTNQRLPTAVAMRETRSKLFRPMFTGRLKLV